MEQLFNQITEITGDKIVTAKVFLALKDYVYQNEKPFKETVEPGEEYQYFVDSNNLDFGDYVFETFVEKDWAKI
jgi:hypothetical protein